MSKYKTICLDKVSMEVEYPPEGREASLAERVRTWLPLTSSAGNILENSA